MSARKRAAPEQAVTAWPRPISEELRKRVAPEEGLSVDPEELGIQFLQNATEQSNFESSEGGDASELSIVDGPPTDDPLTGPNFEPDHDIWEQTVDVARQNNGTDAARAEASRGGGEQDPELSAVDQEIDFTDESIHEASLLDEEGDELGETRTPDQKAEDGARTSRK